MPAEPHSPSSDVHDILESFIQDGWIREVLFEVKSGKEATVHCCRGGDLLADASSAQALHGGPNRDRGALTPNPSPGRRGEGALVAAKVYRPIETRRFKNDAIYTTGRVHLVRKGRAQRAVESKSSFGREVQYATWIDQEWQTMHVLHDASLDVPQPLARNDRAILMTFLGDESGPAPKLSEVELDRAAAGAVLDRLLLNIERMLDLHVIHGDLSPFNVLYWESRAVIIDFPQAVDPRLNPAARPLLARDIENVCTWARKRGIQRDHHRITSDLWRRFTLGEIG